jgi:hypothetical protein
MNEGRRQVMPTHKETIAHALTESIHQQQSTYARVAKPGRLARNTVRLIALGRTKQPTESTLIKLALGLSVHLYTGAIDRKVLTRALARLGHASGHQNLGEQWVREEISILLATVTASLERAEDWVELIADYPELDVGIVRRAVENIARQDPLLRQRKRGARPAPPAR